MTPCRLVAWVTIIREWHSPQYRDDLRYWSCSRRLSLRACAARTSWTRRQQTSVPRGIRLERPEDQGGAFVVHDDGVDLATGLVGPAHVEVSQRRLARGAALLDLLVMPLLTSTARLAE